MTLIFLSTYHVPGILVRIFTSLISFNSQLLLGNKYYLNLHFTRERNLLRGPVTGTRPTAKRVQVTSGTQDSGAKPHPLHWTPPFQSTLSRYHCISPPALLPLHAHPHEDINSCYDGRRFYPLVSELISSKYPKKVPPLVPHNPRVGPKAG